MGTGDGGVGGVGVETVEGFSMNNVTIRFLEASALSDASRCMKLKLKK